MPDLHFIKLEKLSNKELLERIELQVDQIKQVCSNSSCRDILHEIVPDWIERYLLEPLKELKERIK